MKRSWWPEGIWVHPGVKSAESDLYSLSACLEEMSEKGLGQCQKEKRELHQCEGRY